MSKNRSLKFLGNFHSVYLLSITYFLDDGAIMIMVLDPIDNYH